MTVTGQLKYKPGHPPWLWVKDPSSRQSPWSLAPAAPLGIHLCSFHSKSCEGLNDRSVGVVSPFTTCSLTRLQRFLRVSNPQPSDAQLGTQQIFAKRWRRRLNQTVKHCFSLVRNHFTGFHQLHLWHSHFTKEETKRYTDYTICLK